MWGASSRLQHRRVAVVFSVMLVVVGLATMASILATAGLGFIGFIPIVGLTVLPLQLAAWLARGLIFQYLGLSALSAYARLYHGTRDAAGAGGSLVPGGSRMKYSDYLSRAAGTMQESAIRKMGTVTARVPDLISFAPGYPSPDTFPWDDFREITSELLGAREGTTLQYGPTRGFRPLLDAIRRRARAAAASNPRSKTCSSPPARSRVSIWSPASCSIRATSRWSNCLPTPGRSPRSATCRQSSPACVRRPTASIWTISIA